MDRFIGEVEPDPPRQARAHFISVLGGDTQIAAVNAATSRGERFEMEGPGVERISVCLGRNAQTNKGALQLADRKKPIHRLVGISEEFSTPSTATGRTLLPDAHLLFVWSSLAAFTAFPVSPGGPNGSSANLNLTRRSRHCSASAASRY